MAVGQLRGRCWGIFVSGFSFKLIPSLVARIIFLTQFSSFHPSPPC